MTIITNGGDARIKGIENELEWAATNNLTLSTSFTFLDGRLTQNYCGIQGVTNCPSLSTPVHFGPGVPALIGPQGPSGTNLPLAPKFKGNLIARYQFDEMAGWKPFGQAAWVYQSQSTQTLRIDQQPVVGNQLAYGLVDLTGGVVRDNATVQLVVTNVADKRAQLTRFTQISPTYDNQPYIIPSQPRTIWLKFGQKF